jgi:hypothetical protein
MFLFLALVSNSELELLTLQSMLVPLGLELEAAGKPPLCMVVVAAGVTELEGADLWW